MKNYPLSLLHRNNVIDMGQHCKFQGGNKKPAAAEAGRAFFKGGLG